MCFLYYALARNEERNMLRAYGESYWAYLRKTSAFIPGDRRFLGLSAPGPITVSGFLRGLAVWSGALVVAFAAGIGMSAFTITHRGLPVVEKDGMVALERRVVFEDRLSRSECILEFFGKNRLGEQLRRRENVRERLETSLALLAVDERVRRSLSGINEPYVVAAVPINPERTLFEKEQKVQHHPGRYLSRIYLAVLAGEDFARADGSDLFNGYLIDKERKMLLSVLVDPEERRIIQVTRVGFSEIFVDFYDRLLDKETF